MRTTSRRGWFKQVLGGFAGAVAARHSLGGFRPARFVTLRNPADQVVGQILWVGQLQVRSERKLGVLRGITD